ncbi:MAG: phosphatase PAP2 family protein [Actinomycetota bacterium]|nr:phosphatase PAP2 family protein [Actinomycetota bacterium]
MSIRTASSAADRPSRAAEVGRVVGLLLVGMIVLWGLFVGLGELIVHFWARSRLGRADGSVEKYLAAHRNATGNTVTMVLVYLADTLTVAIITAVVALGVFLVVRRLQEPLFLVAAVVGEVTTFVAVTAVVDRHRPPVSHLDASPPTSSFPSGHTAAAVCLYGGIALLCGVLIKRRNVRRLMWVIAAAVPVLVAVGRVYRGMHFPTDVLAGGVLGVLWLTWLMKVYPLGKATARARTRA